MSQDCINSGYPHMQDQFSFSDEEIVKLKEYSSQTYIQDEITPFNNEGVDHLRVLDLSLKPLLKLDAFQKKKGDFRNKLLNRDPEQFEAFLTEIVVGGLLAQSNIPIRSFEYEYQYDNNTGVHKNLDICAVVGDTEVFFEIATRRKYNHNGMIPGVQGIDEMHLTNIQTKYMKNKRIKQAYESNLLPAQPLIFVVNSLRTLQHAFTYNAEPFLKECKLLHSLIMFSGYRIVNDSIKLSQGNIYYNPWCIDSIKSKIDNKALTELIKSWSVDVSYDLESQQKLLNTDK